MWQYALPVLYALFIWWFSTGLIVYLDGLPRRTFRWTVLGSSVVAVAALAGLAWSSGDTTMAGAYCAFTCGLLVWGWQEVGFLMGPMTGPRKVACPPGCCGWQRLGYAIQTVLYHELGLMVSAGLVVAATWGGANQIGTYTFLVLWAMRQSAKLNLFLGVRNLAEEFLPAHLAFLETYLRRRPMNLLFPVSVTVSTILLVMLVQRAGAADATEFAVVGNTFLAALLALAVLEHWFLVVPLPATELWRWSLRTHTPPGEAATLSRPVDLRTRETAADETLRRDDPIPALSATP